VTFCRKSEDNQGLTKSAPTAEGLSGAEEAWVCSLARQSTHPQAVRIARSLADKHVAEPVEGFAETPGCGILGHVQGHEVRLGSRAWLFGVQGQAERDTALAPAATSGQAKAPSPLRSVGALHSTSDQGSVVCLAIDGTLRGEFLLANAIRPETEQLLRGLGECYELALLSGDNEKERDRFRSLFGSNAALHFNQSPLDKLDFIRGLQESGRRVMMVGDGLNDAGALKQSDVGVAVIEKAGAFSPASDVILEAGRVPRLSRILALARKTTQIVRLSFGISAAYNVAGVGIAAAGILSPVICAILMPVSSISVVLFACGATNLAARRAGLTK
jgi:Cu+-exporting ATPase